MQLEDKFLVGFATIIGLLVCSFVYFAFFHIPKEICVKQGSCYTTYMTTFVNNVPIMSPIEHCDCLEYAPNPEYKGDK